MVERTLALAWFSVPLLLKPLIVETEKKPGKARKLVDQPLKQLD